MSRNDLARWPPLPYEDWRDTYATLHLRLQIVGKICLAQCAWINHSWHVALQVTARGLATRLIGQGTRSFQIDFDFVDHRLGSAILTTRRKFFAEDTVADDLTTEALIVAEGLREAARQCNEGQAPLHARLIGAAQIIEWLCRSRGARP